MTVEIFTIKSPQCIYCGGDAEFIITEEQAEEMKKPWGPPPPEGRRFIQDIFPDWDPDEREMLVSGTHPKCWNKMFEGLDEEN